MKRPPPTQTSKGRNPKKAFSLIELLAVIAVLALIAGLTVPAIYKSRSSAGKAACASNLRACGNAISLYAAGHSGKLPDPFGGTQRSDMDALSQEFIRDMAPYIEDYAVWGCPSVGVIPIDSEKNTGGAVRGSYQYFPHHFSQITNILSLGARAPIMQDQLYKYQSEWRSNHAKGGVLWEDALSRNPSFRTYKGGVPEGFNVLFADGSVQWNEWTEDTPVVNPTGSDRYSSQEVYDYLYNSD